MSASGQEATPEMAESKTTLRWWASIVARLVTIDENRYLLAVVGIFVFALAIRLYRLDQVPPALYYDEITSTYSGYLLARGGLTIGDTVPVLIYAVTGSYPIYFLFGPSTFFARLPVAVYGSAIIFPVYLLAERLFGKNPALLSAVIAAVVPWGFHFSRFALPSISFAFWVTTYVFALVGYCQTKRTAFKYLFAIALFASFYTHAMALPFGAIFLVFVFPILWRTREITGRDVASFIGVFVLSILPYGLVFFEPSGAPAYTGYSAFQVSKNLQDLVTTWADSIYVHLHPDFLVFTGGTNLFLPVSPGFTHRAGNTQVFSYADAGYNGMLNWYGILVYPALALVVYRILRKQSRLVDFILGSWVLAYALASGYAYYDNPNAARNAEGFPAFVLLIVLFLVALSAFIQARVKVRQPKEARVLKTAIVVGIAILIAVPSAQYFSAYFNQFPVQTAQYFDYEYRALADYLTSNNLWNRDIYFYATNASEWYAATSLSFYNDSARSHIFTVWSLADLEARANASSVLALSALNDVQNLGAMNFSLAYRDTLYYPDGSVALVVAEAT